MIAIQIIKKKEAWQIIEFGKPSEGLLPTRLPCLVSQREAKRECFPFIISFKWPCYSGILSIPGIVLYYPHSLSSFSVNSLISAATISLKLFCPSSLFVV